jgi:uncharacterized protein (TIGR03435 family)
MFRLNGTSSGTIGMKAAIVALIAGVTSLSAQSGSHSAGAFEAASIKPSAAREAAPGFRISNGRFTGRNATVRFMVAIAWGVQNFQVSGGPAWSASDGFDVDAKSPDPKADTNQIRLMLQALLADRFKLAIHHETRESAIYALIVGPGGARILPSADQTPGGALGPRGSLRVSAHRLIGTAVPLPLFASVLGQQLGRTIVDRTGLSGRFDVDLQWRPADDSTDGSQQADLSSPSIFTAVREQLGLELESTRGSAGFLVIDRVKRPSGN